MTGLSAALYGALALAAVSTLGDFVWATWIPRHRTIYGLTHGTLLFLAIGLFLGLLTRRPAAGAMAGALVGGLAAGSFYVIAPVAGYSSMFVSWFAMWIALGVLYAWLAGLPMLWRPALGRGIAAAIGSAAAFYAVSGIWMPFNPVGLDYLWHLAAWTIAYLPGFAALLVGQRSGATPPRYLGVS
jgi:hypothetical protein